MIEMLRETELERRHQGSHSIQREKHSFVCRCMFKKFKSQFTSSQFFHNK